MKDFILGALFYLIWNSPVHIEHPTAIPVLLTLWIVFMIIELFVAFIKEG
jgi:hypothetical protein